MASSHQACSRLRTQNILTDRTDRQRASLDLYVPARCGSKQSCWCHASPLFNQPHPAAPPMKFLDTTSLNLVLFADHPPSEYIIFSYATDQPSAKLLTHHHYNHLSSWTSSGTRLPEPLFQACQQARARNVGYIWVPVLCVDQSSSADLSESVTASFRLVWNASVCIVHLSDLSPERASSNASTDSAALEKSLSESRWFTRSWTLQDLVASRRVEFYDRNWNLRGIKSSTSSRPSLEMLSRVSGVDTEVLADRNALWDISLGRRLSWAARRRSSRPEDAAYALMGICGVGGRLTPRYGEGCRRAFHRLQGKILKTTSDMSILAWSRQERTEVSSSDENDGKQQQQPPFSGILADSPADFSHFACNPAWTAPFKYGCELGFNNRGLCVQGPVFVVVSNHPSGTRREVAFVLEDSPLNPAQVAILLKEIEPGLFVRSNPETLCHLLRRKDGIKLTERICVRLHVGGREARRMFAEQKGCCWRPASAEFILEDAFHSNNLIPALSGRRMSKRGADEMLGSGHNDQAEIGYSSDGASSSSSSTNSVEDDVLLFDSLPEKPELLDDGHPFHSVLPDLANLALSAWTKEKMKAAAAAHPNKETPSMIPERGASSNSSPRILGLGNILHATFRLREEDNLPEEHQDNEICDSVASIYTGETDHDDPDAVMVGRESSPLAREEDPLLLACPFYRLDPAQHHSCMGAIELCDTRTIKQHAIVDHRLPEYCPVCHDVFSSAAERDRHVVARSCGAPPAMSRPPIIRGVSEDQVEALAARRRRRRRHEPENDPNPKKRRRKRKQHAETVIATTEEEEWYRIWNILFPDVVPKPTAVYLSSPREREVAALRAFWQAAGPELVSGLLRERGLLRWEDPREEAALAALHASVLERVMEQSGLAFPVTAVLPVRAA